MSISAKITLVVSIIAAATLAAGSYLSVLLHESRMVEQKREEARLLARVVQLSAEPVLRNLGQLGALEYLVSRNSDAALTFYDRSGRAVAPVPTEEEPVVNSRLLRTMERKLPEEEVAEGAFAYRVPLLNKGVVAGALELRFDMDRAMTGTWTWTSAGIAAGLLLAFAALVGLFSRRSIGRPVDQLMEGMDHVIKGDLTAAIPIDRNDEIGLIAYRFNEMTAQLRDAQEEIRRNTDSQLQLEQRLRQSEKLATIGQLSAEIAHEVGTPLNVIGGRARTLTRKADRPDEVVKNSKIIADQADRITKIIQQMLDLSRARAIQRVPVDLPGILQDALSLFEYQAERGKIQVQLDNGAALPPVQGDPDGLQQVFINLLHNAIQAMPQGGTLTVGLSLERRRRAGLDLVSPQPFVAAWIADTGEGISEAVQEQIFEPFYSTKGRGEGTGLGLTVVHGIVKEHDGWVEVSPEEPHGARFTVYLPVDEEQQT